MFFLICYRKFFWIEYFPGNIIRLSCINISREIILFATYLQIMFFFIIYFLGNKIILYAYLCRPC